MEKIKDLFNSLVKQDEVQAQADFGAAIGEKLQQALDVRKISVTADVFNKPQSVKEEVEVIDESKYKKATNISAFLLPIASLTPPANSIAIRAPNVGELTTKPCCQSFKLNSASIKPLAPAITLASKPNMNPPRETISV